MSELPRFNPGVYCDFDGYKKLQMIYDGNGEWVKYDDIKSDRALLKEAKGILEKIYDKRFSVVAFLDYNEIKDFLARAKERLGK